MSDVRMTNTAWSTVRNWFEIRTDAVSHAGTIADQRGIGVLRLPNGTVRISTLSSTDEHGPSVSSVFLERGEVRELVVALMELAALEAK